VPGDYSIVPGQSVSARRVYIHAILAEGFSILMEEVMPVE
jgi:hypothetical protein